MSQTRSRKRKHILDDYVRVSERMPCPKCGRVDWCLVHKSGRKVVCTRKKSGKPVRSWHSNDVIGYVHYIAEGQTVAPKVTEQKHEYLTPRQVQEYIDGITSSRNTGMIERLAKGLGLSLESLIMMHATYDQDKAVAVFPMYDHRKMPTGCRYRRNDGKKYSLKGGREGLFVSREFTNTRTIWVAEGPTDAAALCEIGFTNTIGRPNCTGGAEFIKRLVANHRRTPIIVVSDPDEVGLDGATSLAKLVSNPAIVISGPCDVREFSTKRLKNDARASIIEGLTGDEVTTWRPVFRNQQGLFHDFVGGLSKRV